MASSENIYFASDFHLGLGSPEAARKRELHVVEWLDSIKSDAKAIYLVGDVFDFWWEYKTVVPKGFTRFLGKISEMTDSGIEVHFFTGNHDMWIGDYLSSECGMTLHDKPVTLEMNNHRFYLAHGHGLSTDSISYKILLWIFKNRFIQRLYSMLHPSISVFLGHKWSKDSRLSKGYAHPFQGEENESLFIYAKEMLEYEKVDFFIFGHRHLALDHDLKNGSRVLILGNWFSAPCYAKWDGNNMELVDLTSR